MKTSLLVIGERKIIKGKSVDPSCNAFIRHLNGNLNGNSEIITINYKDVLASNLPILENKKIRILLFFPFQHWDKYIEVYDKDARVYGDKIFGKEFKQFFANIEKILINFYRDKQVEFVNPPQASVLDRDKEECKVFLRKHNIPTPRSYKMRSLKDIRKVLDRGESIYIKPRFGSMGKGISYLSNGLLMTNFLFLKGKVISHSYDYNWRFHEITKKADQNKFLKIMISKGFIFEEAIDPPIHKGRRSDFRVYCIYGKIPYFYLRSTPAVSLVTNWSQGGTIEQKKKFMKYIPASKLKQVKSLARKVTKNLKMNYAGVDVIFSKDYKKIYVLEAHSFPGYEKGFDLMHDLANKLLSVK